MQTVSDDWKEIHKRSLLNETLVEVSLDIADPDALADAESQDNGSVYISDSTKLTDGVEKTPTPYCTLEQNLWCLDGSRKAIPPSEFGDESFISEALSDERCIFSTKMPVITISFSHVFEKLIPGITITWSETYNEFADTFTVTAYNGDTVIVEKEVVGNRSVKTLIFADMVGYDRIEIVIKKWCLPLHRARLEEILVGLNRVYKRGDLFDYSHTQSVDPVSTSLPKSEIKFSINNIDGEYNPYNTDGLAKYLNERQEIKTRYGLKKDDNTVEWINGGTFYLSEWYAKQNSITADFTARDLLEFMSDIYYDNDWNLGIRSLYELAQRVLTKANLPKTNDGKDRWYIHESLGEIDTTAPLPEDTLANCLQLIANAGRCTIYQDRDGILRIEPLKFDAEDYEINSFNSYSKAEITLSKPIKQVIVKVYDYSDDGTTTTYNEVVEVPDVAKGEVITIDNPLVTEETYPELLGAWIAEHLGHRMTLDMGWRADVRLDALDIVTNVNDYNTNRVRITEVEYKYNGAFRATGKGKVIGDG